MRKIFVVFAMLLPFFLNAQTDVVSMIREGKLKEAWNYLHSEVKGGNLSFETLEMFGNVTFEITENNYSKKDITEYINQTMPILEKNAFQQTFTKVQQARIFHKYNTLFAKKAQIQGATAALKVLPQVFDNADRCIVTCNGGKMVVVSHLFSLF